MYPHGLPCDFYRHPATRMTYPTFNIELIHTATPISLCLGANKKKGVLAPLNGYRHLDNIRYGTRNAEA